MRKASLSAQMANETNLCAEESWAVRTKNSGSSSWCGSAFSQFPVHLSCWLSLHIWQLQATCLYLVPNIPCNEGQYQKISWRPLVYLWSDFSGFLGSTCPETVCHRAVSSEDGDLSCRQHDQPKCNCIKMVRMLGRKARVKTSVSGMCFYHVMLRIFLRQVVWK